MDFFKKAGQKGKGGKGEGSLFGKMKIKGPSAANKNKEKQQKPIAQTQNNLNFSTPDIQSKEEKKEPTFSKKMSSQKVEVQQEKPEERTHEIPTKDTQQPYDPVPIKKQSPKQSPKAEQPEPVLDEQDTAPEQYAVIPDYSGPQKQLAQSVITKVSQSSKPKESASQSNFQMDKNKGRKRKESNPFLNQIRKNTTVSNPKDNDKQLQDDFDSDVRVKVEISKKKKSDKELLLEELSAAHVKLMEFIAKQKDLKDSIIDIASSVNEFKEQLTECSRVQCEYVEKQMYEEAESIQNKIENIQSKIIEQEGILKNKQETFYQNQYEQLKFLKENHVENKKMVRKIKLIELQLLEDSSNIKRKLAEYQENQMVKIDNQNKKITRLENDFKFQSEQLSAYEKQFEADLQAKRKPLHQNLKASEAIKNTLQAEIKQLEALLAKKKQSLKQVSTKVTKTKKQIQDVQDAFKQQGIKLEQRKMKVSDLKAQKQKLQSNVDSLQKKMKKQISQMEKNSQEFENQASSLSTLCTKIEESASNFDDQLESKKVKVDNFIHNTKILKGFQEKHKKQKELVEEIKLKKSNIAAQANGLQQKRKQLKANIPKLESQQKAMVVAKNFKAAGMKKNEIKESQQQIDEIAKKIEHCFVEEKRFEQEIEKIQKEQAKFIDEQNEIRKNLAISQFKFNQFKLQQLREQRNWLKQKLNKQLQNKYLQTIEEQLENLIQEIKYIGEEYELDISFLNEQKDEKSQAKKPLKQKSVENEEKQQQEHQNEQNGIEIPDYGEKQDQNEGDQKAENEQNDKQVGRQEEDCEKKEEKHEEEAAQQQEPAQDHHQAQAQEEEEEQVGYTPLQLD